MQEYSPNVYLYEVLPAWPLEFSDFHRSLTDMFTVAFGVQSLDEIPDRIRIDTKGVAGRQTLVYVRHEPVVPGMIITPAVLENYLEWWDCNFAPLMEHETHALLGVSFIVRKPGAFETAVRARQRLDYGQFNHTVFHLLEEMKQLKKRHLVEFLQTHNFNFPAKRIDHLLDRILEECNGQYERVLESLKSIEEYVWNDDDNQASPSATEDEVDYN